jgi:hypothetical protein
MTHLKIVAGTAYTAKERSSFGINDSVTVLGATEAEREAAARKIFRSIKLPGENQTVAELLAELGKNARDEKASELDRSFRHHQISIRLHKFGISVKNSSPFAWSLNGKLTACLTCCPEELLDVYPELEPYLYELCFLTL